MNPILARAMEAKKKLEQEQASKKKRTGGRVRYMQLGKGTHNIRLLPPWTTEGEFAHAIFRKTGQHWGITPDQRGPMMCPVVSEGLEGDCPVCEFVAELREDKTDLEAKEVAGKIRANVKYLANVLDLADPVFTAKDAQEYDTTEGTEFPRTWEVGDPKVKVLLAPSTVYDDIISLISSQGHDVTDLVTGNTLTIERQGSDRFDTKYKVMPAFKSTAVANPEKLSLYSLDQIGFVMDYDSMLQALQSGVGGQFETSKTKRLEAPATAQLPKTTATKVSSNTPDLKAMEAEMKAKFGVA